jgi:hypothetical protein
MALFRIPFLFRASLLAAGLGGSLSVTGASATEPVSPPELASDTSDVLNTDFRPAYDAKDWDKSIAVLQGILPKVGPESYDAAYVYRAEGTIYLQNKNNPALGVQNLERAVAIDDHKHYFQQKDVQDILYSISQTSFAEAVSTKDPKAKQELFAKTLTTLERWLVNADSKALNEDSIHYVAAVYFAFGQGIEVGVAQKTDRAMLEKAMVWIDRGLRSVTHPRDALYVWKVAALYQLERIPEMADYLELELKEKPDNKGNWQELASIYQQLANSADEKKDTSAAFRYNVRVILTLERAQKLGFMNTPADNFHLVGFYSGIDQLSKACELLEKGLKDQTIESTPENWVTLGAWYQGIHRNDKSVQTFVTASELFPTNAEIEYQLAQVYLNISDEPKALEHIQACIAKGGTAKPHVGLLFYAYVAMDLQKFDEALKAANAAAVAAQKDNATDAVHTATKIEATIKANIQDIENRKLQMKH